MEPEDVKRKLAAILAADVVGYARLMEVDEESTLRTLNSHRGIIDRLVARHDGRIFGAACRWARLRGSELHDALTSSAR